MQIVTLTKFDLKNNKYAKDVRLEDLRCSSELAYNADVIVYWDGERAWELKNRNMTPNFKLELICRTLYEDC